MGDHKPLRGHGGPGRGREGMADLGLSTNKVLTQDKSSWAFASVAQERPRVLLRWADLSPTP